MPSSLDRALDGGSAGLDAAYVRCGEIARKHYENFPVVSRLLSRRARRALAAVYAFARAADDTADEDVAGPGGPSPAERLAVLAEWERRLRACAGADADAALPDPRVTAPVPSPGATDPSDGGRPRPAWRPDPRDADATFLALGDTIRGHALDLAPFLDLLSAFRQDVTVARYETRADLLDYCRRSAEPVGRIVLAIHGVRDERRVALSDRICTALQLANFWQDIAIDRAKGRVYLPAEDLRRHGVAEADLDAPAASARLRRLVLEETAWTRSLFEAGRPLIDDPPAGLGTYLRLVWHGGMRIVELIEAAGGDVLMRRPRLGRIDAVRLFLRALSGRRGSPRAARQSPADECGARSHHP